MNTYHPLLLAIRCWNWVVAIDKKGDEWLLGTFLGKSKTFRWILKNGWKLLGYVTLVTLGVMICVAIVTAVILN
jgi:hypothetical protein